MSEENERSVQTQKENHLPEGNRSLLFENHKLLSFVLIAASIVIIAFGIRFAQSIISTILLSTFIAVLLALPMKFLRRHGVSQGISLSLVLVLVIAITFFTGTLLKNQISDFIGDLPDYRTNLPEAVVQTINGFKEKIPFFKQNEKNLNRENTDREEAIQPTSWYWPFGDKTEDQEKEEVSTPASGVTTEQQANTITEPIPLPMEPPAEVKKEELPSSMEDSPENEEVRQMAPPVMDTVPQTAASPEKTEDSSEADFIQFVGEALFRGIGEIVSSLSSFVSSTLIILILVVVMLFEAMQYPEKIIRAYGEGSETKNDLVDLVTKVNHYMIYKTIISLMVAVLVSFALILLGVKYPFLWGVVAFLLNYIPTIGPIAATLPPIVLALVDSGFQWASITAIVLLAIHCVIGYVLEPKLFGTGLGLSPLVVLISMFVSGWLLGGVGVFLSPILALMIKVILLHFPETKPLAYLMGDGIKAIPNMEKKKE